MRVLALLGVAILGVSIYYAPAYRSARPAGRLGRSMADPDPRERIRRGEAERALGMMMSGYLDSDPDDPEVARGKFLTMVKLWAVAYAQPELRVMASREIDAFIARHKELDPGGSLIDEAVTAWIELRLTLPERMGYVVVAPAIFMAARNDRASIDRVLGFMKRGPFYGHLFPYVRRFHLRWDFVEQAIRQSLNTSDERARIEAGATLLDYHSLFGVGKELLETERKELLQSLTQGLRKIRIDYKAADRMDRHAEAILFGLALLRSRSPTTSPSTRSRA
jgi:hypothetical protein